MTPPGRGSRSLTGAEAAVSFAASFVEGGCGAGGGLCEDDLDNGGCDGRIGGWLQPGMTEGFTAIGCAVGCVLSCASTSFSQSTPLLLLQRSIACMRASLRAVAAGSVGVLVSTGLSGFTSDLISGLRPMLPVRVRSSLALASGFDCDAGADCGTTIAGTTVTPPETTFALTFFGGASPYCVLPSASIHL